MTSGEAGKIVARLVEAYPVPAWTDAAADLWVEMLGDLDRDLTARVVRDVIASRSQRPTIADIRTAVASAGADGGCMLPADEAWGVVQRAIGTVGRYRAFPTDHPLVAQVVDQIGWQAICDSESPEILRAQFHRAYTALLERSRAQAAASPGASWAPQLTTRRESTALPPGVQRLVAQIVGDKR